MSYEPQSLTKAITFPLKRLIDTALFEAVCIGTAITALYLLLLEVV